MTGGAGGKGPKGAGSGEPSNLREIRQKAIQASKENEKKGGTINALTKNLIDSNAKLNASIQQLIITVNKSAGGGYSRNGGGGNQPFELPAAAKAKALGGALGGIPFIGGILKGIIAGAGAAGGYVVSKIHQIGTAYMEETSKQRHSVGVGGFRWGQGLFHGEEISAGMAAYGKMTGKFSNEVGPKEKAMQLSNVYGTSLEETMKQAGIFDLSGASKGAYEKTANTVAGLGIQSQLPTLLSAISDHIEEGVTAGFNKSNVAEKMGARMAALTMLTQSKNVGTMLNAVKSMSGTKEAVSKGNVNDLESLMGWVGSERDIEEKLKNPATRMQFLKESKAEGLFQGDEYERYIKKGDFTTKGINEVTGGYLPAFIKQNVGKMGTDQYGHNIVKGMGGMDVRGKALTLGKNLSDIIMYENYREPLEKVNKQIDPRTGAPIGGGRRSAGIGREAPPDVNSDVNSRGARALRQQEKYVEGVSRGVALDVEKANMVFKYGAKFAEMTDEMTRAMMKFVDEAAKVWKGDKNLENKNKMAPGSVPVPAGMVRRGNSNMFDPAPRP